MRIRNFTPHALRLYFEQDPNGAHLEIDSEGTVRAIQEDTAAPSVSVDDATLGRFNFPTCFRRYSGSEGVPPFGEGATEPEHLHEGDLLVVSLVALEAMRPEMAALDPYGITVVAPDTGPSSVVRDGSGNILGVTSFVR